jgi:ABC-type uncharacterized transport system substrate-binding protein
VATRDGFSRHSFMAILLVFLVQAAAAGEPRVIAGERSILWLTNRKVTADEGSVAQMQRHLAQRTSRQVRVELMSTADLSSAQAVKAIGQRLNVRRWDAVLAQNMTLAKVAQQQDDQVPIVFRGAADPVRMCLVKSLLRPSTNSTGYTSHLEATPKMAEALRDAYPKLRRIVVVVEAGRQPEVPCGKEPPVPVGNAVPCLRSPMDWERASQLIALGDRAWWQRWSEIRLEFLGVCALSDIGRWLDADPDRESVGFVVPLQLMFHLAPDATVRTFAATRRPVVYARRSFVQAGGLMSLSPRTRDEDSKHIVDMLVDILNGRPPSDIPVRMPDGFELAINLGAASRLAVPPSGTALRRTAEFVR